MEPTAEQIELLDAETEAYNAYVAAKRGDGVVGIGSRVSAVKVGQLLQAWQDANAAAQAAGVDAAVRRAVINMRVEAAGDQKIGR